MTEDRDLRIQAQIRDERRCSRPPQETPIPEVHSVGHTDASKQLSSKLAGHIAPSTHRHFSGQRFPRSLPTTYLPTDWINANKRLRSNSAFLLIAARLLLRWTYIGRPGRLHEFGTQRSLAAVCHLSAPHLSGQYLIRSPPSSNGGTLCGLLCCRP